jgi:flagellar hook-basal body complex protein FliE
MQKASVGMSLLLEVRNKLISAYDEVKRMQF